MRTPLILIVTLLTVVAGSFRARAQDHPNIVMIISDDQAWTDYSFMDHPQIKTPHLDQLASQSVLFRRGYVPTALCRPSLMSMITGRYAHQHRITGNDPSAKGTQRGSEKYKQLRQQLIDNIDRYQTLPRALAEVGYVSFQSGKWWEGNFKQGGFTDGMTRGFPQPGGRHGDDGLKIGREGMQPVQQFMERAVEQQQPFFVWYAPFLPHTPHTPPDRILKKYQQQQLPETVAKYYAMCEWFDETCGQLLQKIDDLGVTDDTIVVYVCDNGWIQNPDKRGYAPRSKQTAYEGGIRTPIMFRWPQHWKPADRPELCTSLDLMPTLLAAAGLKPPEGLPGMDLSPYLSTGEAIPRNAIFGESFAHDVADLENPDATLLYRWCIKGRWKLLLTFDGEVNRYQSTHPRDVKGPQLFDLTEDPYEKNNVADQHPDVVQNLRAMIVEELGPTKREEM